MIIVGIDPGSHTMGVGAVNIYGKYVARDTLKATSKNTPLERLNQIDEKLEKWFEYIMGWNIVVAVCIEEPFIIRVAAKSALILSGAFWVAARDSFEVEVPILTVKPVTVKKMAGVPTRGAGKIAMVQAAQTKWGDTREYSDHEADALWIAMCGLDLIKRGDKGVSRL